MKGRRPLARRAAPAARRRRPPSPGARGPVIVELEGASCKVRLRITEDAFSFGVMAEFDETPAEAFEVEIDGSRVFITLAPEKPRGTPDLAAGQGLDPARRDPGRSHISLSFGQSIDAAASRGECSDGLLHLSLRKGSSSVPDAGSAEVRP